MAYGRYTSTPGFNIAEAFEAVIKLIDDPEADFTIYPDDPQGCTIVNKADLKKILDGTDLKVRMRSTYTVSHKNGRDVIEIENTPFEVSPETVMESIQRLAEKGELPELSDVGGFSENFGLNFKLVLEVKKGYDPDTVMTKLYKKTQLEETFAIKYAFVKGLEAVDYTLRTAINEWIRSRRGTIKRMYKIRRVNNLKRMHFLEPLIKVIQSGEIEEFINIVRKNTVDNAIVKIMKKFNLTDYQAEKIVGVKISDLSVDKLNSYIEELTELTKEEAELAKITKSKKKMNKIIIEQLKEGIEKYKQPRKSKVMQLIDSVKIPDTMHYLIFTNRYVKKLPFEENGYRIGRIDNGEKVLKVMTVNNRDTIAIFTKDGRCLPIQVNDIGNSGLQFVGISYMQLGAKDNNFVNAILMDSTNLGKYITSVSETGLISKTPYDDIIDKSKVFAFMKLGKNDYLSNVCISDKKDDILVYTKNGNCALFNFNDFETTSLNTKGVQSAKLSEDDSVIGVISYNKKMTELLTLTDRGYMKRLSIKALPKTKRAGKCIELSSTNGSLISVKAIDDSIDLVFVSATSGVYSLDPSRIKAKARLGRNERVVELKASDYAFELD